ncbi:Hypothetical predicted protein [Paramuricea clavata]|uniref:Uncharacterized protein n=1 Tax=Paramuricea clavata TaxID=317549 RepID=A0A6S7G989_PARCT|nr:Hypothetical predicted protein [Paramuricea clavata]
MLDKRQTLKNELEKMELEQDLVVAQAREKVYADVADEEASTTENLELNLNLEGKTIHITVNLTQSSPVPALSLVNSERTELFDAVERFHAVDDLREPREIFDFA